MLGTVGFESRLLAVVHEGKPPLSGQVATDQGGGGGGSRGSEVAAAGRDWAMRRGRAVFGGE